MSPLSWYLARSAGTVAWALLALSVILGLLLSVKPFGRKPAPAWLLELHRYLGGLALVFTAVHVVALLLDDVVDFSLLDVVTGFTSEWRPAQVALGVVGAWLALAVEVTALLRKRLPKLWRRLHPLSALAYGLATLHLLTAGTDASNTALLVAVQVSLVAVGVLLLLRVALSTGLIGRSTHPARTDAQRS